MFRLRKVLEWREHAEKEALAARLAAQARREELAGALRSLRAQRGELPRQGPQGEGEAILAELAAWSRYAEHLRRREESLRARWERLRVVAEEKAQAHERARAEAEGLRKLCERHWRRSRRKHEKRMQEGIDEAGARRKLPPPGRNFPPAEPDGGGRAPARRHEGRAQRPETPA